MDDRQRELVAWGLATEGCFSLNIQRSKKYPERVYYVPHISFVNSDKGLFDTFIKLVPTGTIYLRDRNERWKPVWTWHLTGVRGQLLGLLEEILPFMPAKGRQVRLLLEFIQIRRAASKKGVAMKLGQSNKTPREDEIYKEMLSLNKRGRI